MVAFIWIACFFCLVMAQVLIKYQGVILGAIPTMILYGATIWLARTLSSLWKKHKKAKNEQVESKQEDQLDIYSDPSILVNYRDDEYSDDAREEPQIITLADVRADDEAREDDEKMPQLVKVIIICSVVCLILLILISSLSKM